MPNLRFALRTLFKTPFVTIVAIVSLALGIGANAAIFSLFNQLLLRALPVQEPERLVNLSSPGPKPGCSRAARQANATTVFSYPMFRDLERVQSVFTGIAAHRAYGANLAFNGQTMNGREMLVSGSYFPVLNLRPALGRLIGPDDDRAPGESPVAVLSYSFWQTRFAGDPNVLNQTMIVNGADDDHRRRRAAWIRRHDARRESRRVRADDAARAGQPVVEVRSRIGAPTGFTCSRG